MQAMQECVFYSSIYLYWWHFINKTVFFHSTMTFNETKDTTHYYVVFGTAF